MLKFSHGTAGSGDDRDVIQGVESCPDLYFQYVESRRQILRGLEPAPNQIASEGHTKP